LAPSNHLSSHPHTLESAVNEQAVALSEDTGVLDWDGTADCTVHSGLWDELPSWGGDRFVMGSEERRLTLGLGLGCALAFWP
jgi:hypothetical protein